MTDGLIYGWMEGFSIVLAVALIIGITTANNNKKEKNFIKLHEEVKDIEISCIRGQHGTSGPVNYNDIVVGDIILVEQGMRVPVDCLLIESVDLLIDESDCGRGAVEPKKKLAPGFDDSEWDA